MTFDPFLKDIVKLFSYEKKFLILYQNTSNIILYNEPCFLLDFFLPQQVFFIEVANISFFPAVS